jgi:hypothetical protein
LFFVRLTDVPERDSGSTRARHSGRVTAMPKIDDTDRLSWPWWSPWALLAVIATSLLTIVATLYDIL